MQAVVALPFAMQVITSLTIPFWVPIIERFTGRYGVYWVFLVLTYYAYLAWVIFAVLLVALLYQWPIAGALWLAIVILRAMHFVRLGARKPAGLTTLVSAFSRTDEEAPLPLAVNATSLHVATQVIGRGPTTASSCARASLGRKDTPGNDDCEDGRDNRPCCGCSGRCCGCCDEGSANVGRLTASDGGSSRGSSLIDNSGRCCSCGCSSGGRNGGCRSGCTGGCSSGHCRNSDNGCGNTVRSGSCGMGSVVLVGNGPSISERGLGSVIDGFDTVVRFNSFVTKGLEENTGSKTSLWCHMMQWYHVSTVEVAQKAAWLPTCYAWNHVVLAPLIFVPNYLMPMWPPRSAITWSPATYWRAHRILGLRLHQVGAQSPGCHHHPLLRSMKPPVRFVQVPTTGFVMLMRLLECVDQVHIVGFDGFSTGKELHYYKERRIQFRVNAAGALLHDWAKEQAAIRRLIEDGRLVLL